MHGQRAPPPPAATTPEVDTDREQTPRSESGLPGWMRSVTQCERPSGGWKPSLNNTDQTYATNHDELHSRDDDDFDDASSVSTTVSSEMNTDPLDTSLEACSFGSFAVGSRDTLGRRGKARKSGAARRRKARARTDLALATFGREAAVLASADAVVAARWAVVAAVKAEVRAEAEAKEVSTRTRRRARWAARRAAAAARTAAMAARDERSVVFYILHFDYKINMWAAGGLVRCRSGRRGVGNGRRRREREREERKRRQRVGVASGMARERERRMELAWWERQESKWAAANAAEATAAKAAAAGVAARWWVRRQGAAARRRATGTTVVMAAAVATTAAATATVGAAPASLCRRAERVLHSRLRHGGRGMRLGGGGKRGWVT